MRIALFYHSLVSDWNHGNAHFLRGVASELCARGHEVRIYEPRDGWSRQNLMRTYGEAALSAFAQAYPELSSQTYDLQTLDLDRTLEEVDLVLVHEWNDHELVRRIGLHKERRGGYVLFFHDTHHRSVTESDSMAAYDLSRYDGVLAFGKVIAEVYEAKGWCKRVFVWHEAADTRRFSPLGGEPDLDLVWIGNWGDEERTAELREFLLGPVRALGLRSAAFGVRYPRAGLDALEEAGMSYGGWIANHAVPRLFASARFTVHVSRRPYVERLPGIPTIRVFEALACGVPLVCAPWEDSERLFETGADFLVARDGGEMKELLATLRGDEALRRRLSLHGRATIEARHTCRHRVDELLQFMAKVSPHDCADGRVRSSG